MKKLYESLDDKSARMFNSDFIEAFSKVHWSVPIFVFVPAILYFLYRPLFYYELPVLPNVLYFIGGFFFWSLMEYSIHRWAFHTEPKSEKGKRIHFVVHGVHHDYPNDSKRLVMPPSVSLPLAALFYLLFYLVFRYVIVYPPDAFFSGFLTGYLAYDITHYAIHHFPVKNNFFLEIKKHHMRHHFDRPDLGFGISHKLWDYAFGTTFPPEQKKPMVRKKPPVKKRATGN